MVAQLLRVPDSDVILPGAIRKASSQGTNERRRTSLVRLPYFEKLGFSETHTESERADVVAERARPADSGGDIAQF